MDKTYFNWTDNIRDWCISRQLWWGHRIPAWYCDDCGEMVVSIENPGKCPKCGCTHMTQDPDTLDTWFSSALWPFSTLGWPEKTEDLDYFYPNDVLVTGYDIIFFWVIRMIFSGYEQMGKAPFHTVLFHGLVRDSQGRKMNYLYCEEHGMEKYMKFTMYKKETTDKKYHENPYRAVNFAKDADGNLLCPNGRKFLFKRTQHVKYNKYGRTEELYECESCEGCQHKQECCPRAHKNRTIRMNQELTAIHQEVLQNLESIHGALLRMNRSIQSEGTFGVLKWDKAYKRLLRRGEKNVILELTLISCGFNLYKYHNKKQRQTKVA